LKGLLIMLILRDHLVNKQQCIYAPNEVQKYYRPSSTPSRREKKEKKIEVKNAKTNSTFSYGSTSYLAGADILVQHKCVNDMIYFKSFRLIDNFVPQLFPATILFFSFC
jgi:hypothetical protein